MPINLRLFLRQTLALTQKTLIIAVKRHWLSTSLRVLVLPIAFLVLLLNLKTIVYGNNGYGVGSSSPVQSLAAAIPSSKKLVFVQPPGLGSDVVRVVDKVASSLSGTHLIYLTDSNDLVTTCRQNLQGTSDCFAAVVFNDSPLTTGDSSKGVWSYTLHADNAKNGFGFNVHQHSNDQDRTFLPLQVALENAMTNSTIVPNTYMFTTMTQSEEEARIRKQFQRLVISSYNIAFFLSMVSPIYHAVSMITSERESGMTQLIDAMGCGRAARIFSYVLAFDILYLPCWTIFGILFWDDLFRTSNVAISLLWQILVGWAISSTSVFAAMFFSKAQMSGIYVTVGFLIFALCGQLMNWGNPKTTTVAVMSFFFPSMNYIFMTGYMSRHEEQGLPTNLLEAADPTQDEASTSRVPGIILLLFLVVQIIVYPILAVYVERWLHGSESKTRTFGSKDDGQVSPDSSPAITASGITKIYPPSLWRRCFTGCRKGNVVAVDDLDLTARRGQILCLLGVNGSGKTTTLEMIGGLQRLTRGSIHMSAAPSQIGICPQRNVLWEELTVREHVQIWNEIKFSTADGLAINNLIEACDLTSKTNSMAKTLSGGQKRKLQLACTFVGGSSICMLDEVTSGLDPLSRRIIWDILLAERAKRTLILTTHFLDEADVLADEVMIISHGRLKCQGSTVELKTRLGGGYKVHCEGLSKAPEIEVLSHKIGDETVYNTPDSESASRLISELEATDCENIVVNGPTIEEVFLREAEEPHAVEGEDGMHRVGTISDELEQVGVHVSPPWDTHLSDSSETTFIQQVPVLFHKRCTILLRNWWPYLIALAMPIAVTPNLKSFLLFYKVPSCLDVAADVHSLELFNFDFGERALGPWTHVLAGPASINSSLYKTLSNFPVGVGVNLQNYSQEVVFMDSLESFQSYVASNQTAIFPGALFMDTSPSAPTYAYVGDVGIEPALLMQTLWSQVRSGIRIEGSFSFFNSLISPTAGNSLAFLAVGISSSFSRQFIDSSQYFCIAQAVYPAFFALYPTFEKIRRVRTIQYSNGIRPLPLWTAYALFDFMFVLVISVACTGILAFQAPHWFTVAYMFPILALYGLSAMLMSYCFSLLARSQLGAFAWAAGVQCIMFLLSVMAFVLIEAFSDTSSLLLALDGSTFGLNLIFPTGNLVRATLVGLNVYIVDCRNGDSVSHPSSIYAYGGPVMYLCLQICFLFWLLSWLEGRHSPHLQLPTRKKAGDDEEETARQVVPEVKDEKTRVENSDSDLLRVIQVSKSFGSNSAVDDVSFGIRSGEILALLGPNGAGKSTIINLIRGGLGPDHGRILLQGIDMETHTRTGQKSIGYCPQFDALDIMTVREHLSFYARAKGIKTVEQDVNLVIEKIGLKPYETRLASKLSGGNKRKLSLAIAILGNPPILLLDEPTSSIDPSSKRSLWKSLISAAANRSLLLTTHSMEEASYLASRAAILSRRLLAVGTIAHLRKKYGHPYHVHLVLRSAPESTEEEMQAVENWVLGAFDGSKIAAWGSVGGQVKFVVPGLSGDGNGVGEKLQSDHDVDAISPVAEGTAQKNHKDKQGGIGSLFRKLEDSKDVMRLAFYSVRPTSLDEVFLNVVKEINDRERDGLRS